MKCDALENGKLWVAVMIQLAKPNAPPIGENCVQKGMRNQIVNAPKTSQ